MKLKVQGSWFMVHGLKLKVHGSWFRVAGHEAISGILWQSAANKSKKNSRRKYL